MIAQIGIAILGVTAVWLSQSALIERRRWASVFGLLGQPFWIWAALDASQWGILALCGLYTFAWAKGLKEHWWPVWQPRLMFWPFHWHDWHRQETRYGGDYACLVDVSYHCICGAKRAARKGELDR